MQTNPISAGSLAGTAVNPSAAQSGSVAPVAPDARSPIDTRSESQGGEGSRHRALGILSQEIRQILSASFSLRFASGLPVYSDPQSANAVSEDALTAGRALAQRSPLSANESLGDLRRQIEDAADDVRELAGGDDDELDDAMQRIRDGIGELEEDTARNVPSSAAVLSFESKTKQRSTIRIRTQEGDVVRFDLRRLEKTSASDVAVNDGNGSFTATEVEVSSRMRTVLSVKGDLNDAEFEAIRNVFAQAETIAAEFFDGDIARAFDLASGIEFDTDQLARVRLRFREQTETDFSFASIRSAAPPPVAAARPAPAAVSNAGPVDAAVPAAAQPPEITAEPAVALAEPAAAPAGAPEIESALPESALDGFFRLLSDFLQSTGEGFGGGSYRYFYSESFRLEILKSMIEVAAPEDSGNAPRTAATLIDGLTESETGDS